MCDCCPPNPLCVLTLIFTVDIEGFDSTNGYSQWANNPAVENADVSYLPLQVIAF